MKPSFPRLQREEFNKLAEGFYKRSISFIFEIKNHVFREEEIHWLTNAFKKPYPCKATTDYLNLYSKERCVKK